MVPPHVIGGPLSRRQREPVARGRASFFKGTRFSAKLIAFPRTSWESGQMQREMREQEIIIFWTVEKTSR